MMSRATNGAIVQRLRDARYPLAAGVIALLLAWWLFAVPFAFALGAAFAVVLAAALSPQRGPAPAHPVAVPKPGVGSNELLGAVLAAVPRPAFILDMRGTVLLANAEAGWQFAATRPGDAFILSFRSPEMRAALTDARTAPIITEYREPGKPQHVRAVYFNAFRLPGESEPRLLVTVDDLSDREAVARMRVDFVANASHELRTPLASLTASIETLLGPARNDPAAQERFLEMMRQQADRMRRLTDNLLSLSRAELHQHRPPTAQVDAAAALREAVEVIAPLAKQQAVALCVDAPDRPVLVLGDRGELIQVFQNLLENAVRHGASGGRVEVTAEVSESPPMLAVHVRDFGPGIPAEHLPRLTERFYRVENGGAQKGTGLGLAIVKHILTRHGGRLDIASRAGEGATFSAEIPVATDLPARESEKQP